MTSDERWLAALWQFVRAQLPPAPARVLEIGCGPLGGFVPMLAAAGYDATGVDPEAPAGAEYSRAEFERYDPPEPADVIVACTSLHHVDDLGEVLDRVNAALLPGGLLVVVEWARERFDEATARWCFARLPEPSSEPGWLHSMSARWRDAGQSWEACCQSWAEAEGIRAGYDVLRALTARFDTSSVASGPYFFSDLADITEAEEQAAIDSGMIQANRIQYVGRKRRGDDPSLAGDG